MGKPRLTYTHLMVLLNLLAVVPRPNDLERLLGIVKRKPADMLLRPNDEDESLDVERRTILDTAHLQVRVPVEMPAILDGTEQVRKLLQRPIPVHACPACQQKADWERKDFAIVYKPHRTKAGLLCPESGRQARGAIQLVSIPVFGKQGSGKSKVVNALVDMIVQRHGAENVHCVISNDFRALQDNIDPKKNVQVLFLDDALDSAFSRGGTPAALRDAIKDFMKTRHKLEKAMRRLHGEEVDEKAQTMDNMHFPGLIYFFMGTQSFKGTEKAFRGGVCIFKTPLEEDYSEITMFFDYATESSENRVRQRNAAWSILYTVQRRVQLEHDATALSQSIVVVPSLGPMILHAPMIEREYFGPPYGRRVEYEEKKPETIMQQRFRNTEHLAVLFNEKHDPNGPGAQALLRDFIRRHFLKILQGEVDDALLTISDASEYLEPAMVRDILDRAKAIKHEKSNDPNAAHYIENRDRIIEKVATEWLNAGGDPLVKKNGIASSKLYAFIVARYRDQPDLRQAAEKEQAKIMKFATAMMVKRLEDSGESEDASSGGGYEEDVSIPIEPHITSPQFVFEVSTEIEALPDRMAKIATKNGKNPKAEKEKWALRAKAWRKRKIDGVPREELALQSEQLFKQKMTGRNLDYWVKDVESALGLFMGAAYEKWWEQMLRMGYRHAGLRRAADGSHVQITNIRRGGGSGHAPDIVVEYADNSIDYWSLKCYSAKEHVTLTVRNISNQKKSNVAPELNAFMEAWDLRDAAQRKGTTGAALPPAPRLCIAFREALTPGAEFYRVFERPDAIQPTANFSRAEIGQPTAVVWTQLAQPMTQPTAPMAEVEDEEVLGITLSEEGNEA